MDAEEEEEDEEENSPKKRKAASKNEGPSAKKAKTASVEVEAEAKKLGFLLKLKSLCENAKVKSSPAEILAELQKQKGSVVAAKKTLLGA